jgi:alpha-galactosidase
MKLVFDRIETRCRRGHVTVDVDNANGVSTSWTVVNDGDEAAIVDAVAIVWRVVDVKDPLRMFRHGYQSWSASGWALFGTDVDPSRTQGAIPLVVDMHHADPATAEGGELRSELVTVVDDDSADPPLVAGFLGGGDHDGTFRLRRRGDDVELWVEAFLGGSALEPGSVRRLHPVKSWALDDGVGIEAALDTWAAAVGASCDSRVTAPYQVGWCSWYHYFDAVAERDVLANLALASAWQFDVFQIDDGFQPAIGDWLATNDKFDSSLDALARRIGAEGFVPGLWLAPFLAGPTSIVAQEHPSWFARHTSSRPLVGMVNDHWGGPVHVLDTTQGEVLEHLEHVARSLVEAGFRYLKLDFTYAPALAGNYANSSRTPAQRVRAGFDAVRRGAGDDVFILGCGAPLGACIGAVDGMRIGPDVAPWWLPPPERWAPPGYGETSPATAYALAAVEARQFMHRRLWLNDPDCVMLRTRETAMSAEEVRRWATAVGQSGGMALVSDDLSLLGAAERSAFDDVIGLGRAHDAPYSAP